MATKLTLAEKIQRNKDKRNASALVGSRYEFENNLEIIEEEIELNNIKYELDIDSDEIISNIIEEREEFLDNNLKIEKEIFERELAGLVSNTQDSWAKKNSIKVNIDSISGSLKLGEKSFTFMNILMKNCEKEIGLFHFNYQKFMMKIYGSGLVFYKDRINLETGEIEDIIYFSWNGEDCRKLDYILWDNDLTWIDFIRDIVINGQFKATIIDGAVTSVGNDLKLSTIKRKLQRREYKS